MKEQKPKPFPDDFDGIRNKISDLADDAKAIKKELDAHKSKPTVWTWAYWEDHKAKLTIILFVLAAITSGGWFVFGLILDSHVSSSIHPLQDETTRINESVQRLTGTVEALQTEVSALRFSTVPREELKQHTEELNKLKNTLAAKAAPTSAGYWPTASQVIRLISQINLPDVDKIMAMHESSFTNVSSKPPGMFGVTSNQRVFLKGHVEGLVFKDCIIRFDPDVQLVNDLFINCMFLLPVQDNSPKSLQEIGRTLLASDLSKVTLNAS